MQVHFSARGNFRPLQTSLRGLNQQMTRSVSGFGRAAAVNVNNPINDMVKNIDRGRMGFRNLGTAMRNQSKFLREHNALMSANATATFDAAGNARVMMDVNRGAATGMARLGQRLAYTNTMMHAFGRNTIAVGKNMQWAGRQVMIGLTLPLTLLANASVKAAEEYDKNMTRIIKVNNEASAAAAEGQEIFDLVSESIRRQTGELVELGASMGFLAAQTTDMVAQFSQMGFVGGQLDQLTEAALRLSRVSGTDLPTSIELARLTAQAFGTELEDLTETFARLNLVENNTALSLDEMAKALPVVAGVANTMGLEIETVSGLLAMMKENGISAKEGATALRTGLIQIVQEATDPAIAAFENVGLNLVQMKEDMQDVSKGGGDVMYFFDELGQHLQVLEASGEGAQASLNDFTAAIGKLTGTRQAARFLTFLSEVPDRFEEGTVAQRAFVGASTEAAEAMRVYDFEQRQVDESAAGTAERLRAELNVELTKIGENFLDVANRIRETGVAIMRWFNNLDDSTKKVVLSFGTFLAVLGPVVMLAGIFTNAFGQIVTVITKVLPKLSLATLQQRALEAAYYDSTRAIVAETAALKSNIAAKNGAAGAAATSATAVRGETAARTGNAASGAASAATRGAGGVHGRTAGALSGMAMMGGTGKMGTAIAAMASGIAKVVAGILAAKVAITTIIGALAIIPILANPQAALQGFRDAIEGPMNRLRESWDMVMSQVRRVMEMFREAGGEGSGLAWISELVGSIAGLLGGLVVDALGIIIGLLSPIINAFEFIFKLVEGITLLFTDTDAALSAFGEALKALGRVIMDVLASVLDVIGAVLSALEEIPGISNLGSEALEGWSDELRNVEFLQSEITDEMIQQNDEARELQERFDGLSGALEEAEVYMQRLRDAGIDIDNMTNEQIMANQLITEEMKVQILAARRLEEITARIVALQGQQANLEVQMTRLRSEENASADALRMTGRALAETQREINDLLEESENVHSNIRDELQWEREIAGFLGDELDDAADAAGDLGSAVNDVEIERLEKQAAALRDRIQESERAAQQWASALQGGVSEVMSDIASSVQKALDDQIKAQEEAFDNREERAKAELAADLERINTVADAQLEVLDEREAREQEIEDARRRFFEAEKARIEFLKNMEQQNVSMQESLARGDVGEAARIRIGLQAGAETFMLESYEREAQKFAEAKKSEIDAERDKINAIREDQAAALKQAEERILRQLEIERDAAQKGAEARRMAVERYLRDWERITPATEAEFRRHLGNLTTNMNGFGVDMHSIASHYTDAAGGSITSGFTAAINRARQVVQEQGKWRAVGENSGAAFRAGLARELEKVESDLERLRNGQNVNISGSSSSPYSNDPGSGSSVNISAGTQGLPRGVGVTNGQVDTSRLNSPGSTTSSSGGIAPQTSPRAGGGGGGMRFFHSGGGVNGGSAPAGLKRDERPAVLQTGEFVMQRSAVKALGPAYMEMLNNVSKYHDGGLIDFSRGSISEGGMMKAMAGFGLGKAATLGAADLVSAGGQDPRITSSYNDDASGEAMGRAAGKQIAAAMEWAAGGAQMGDDAGWRAGVGGGWPRRRWATLSGNTRAAQNYFREQGGFPGGIGAGVHRGVAKSDHSWGKALDFMVAPLGRYAQGDQYNRGWQVANWHVQNPDAFGTKYVIWDKMINSGGAAGWRPYTRYGSNPGPTLGHYDHVHVSYLHNGGMVNSSMPSMRNGGKILTDNVPVNLHKGERVLTEPSTKALESAIQNFASGNGGNTYNLDINVSGGNIDEKALAKKVVFEIDKMERSKGRKRVVSG